MATPARATARLAWGTLVLNLFVIVWGGWVRASGSGAGCGNHWPTCNGVIVPQSPSLHTVVEFTHRLSSAIAVLLIVALLVSCWRTFGRGHPARKGAVAAMLLIVVEAAIGAGLVKFELVAQNASLARAASLGIHLVNTQFLLTAIFLTGWWASGRQPLDRSVLRSHAIAWGSAFIALIVVGMAGAAASLGDTLFPARTLGEGLAQDRSSTVNVLLHIRVWHPLLAVATGIGLLFLASAARQWRDSADVTRAARGVIIAVATQWTVGLLSLVLLVPVPLQLLHLVLADLLWLSVVWLVAASAADYAGWTTRDTNSTIAGSNTEPAPATT
ncbi:MAG TPA: COX15/CtaA family protein [Gemmatimonadales bacterium]|jgi:heme A synthase